METQRIEETYKSNEFEQSTRKQLKINQYDIHFTLKPDMKENTEFFFPGRGKTSEGKQCNLLVVVKREEIIEPERVIVSIPLSDYYNGQHNFQYNNLSFSLPLNENSQDGSQFVSANCGTPINGKQRDLIIVICMVKDDNIQITGSNVIRTYLFSSQYKGCQTTINDVFPSGESKQVNVTLQEGYCVGFNNEGLMQSDGNRGNYYINIQLVDQ